MSGAKDLLYKGSMIKETSQNAKHLGEMWNIDSLAQEGEKNEKNPGRAVGKAAAYTAGAYLGGLLGGAGGAAGGAATETAGSSAAALGDAETAAVQAGMTGAQQAPQAYSSLGYGNTMEAGLTDTGYTPSSLKNALRYGGDSGQPMSQTLGNYAGNKLNAIQSNPGGLLQGNNAKQLALRQGMGLLNPQQPQQQPQRTSYTPPQQQPQMLPYGMSEEEKQRLRMMGYPV